MNWGFNPPNPATIPTLSVPIHQSPTFTTDHASHVQEPEATRTLGDPMITGCNSSVTTPEIWQKRNMDIRHWRKFALNF